MENIKALAANQTKPHASRSGAARRGSALLAGLLRCRKCGHKMHVGYRGGEQHGARYYCMAGGRVETMTSSCQCFAAYKVERAVVEQVLETCQPLGIEASIQAINESQAQANRKQKTLELAFERARYEVDRARRQYDAVDPANRLVAAELEARWNAALAQATEAEARLQAQASSIRPLDEQQRQRLMELGGDLRRAWNDSAAPIELKKRILRTVINEVVADVNHATGFVDLQIHWAGGVHTTLHVRKNKSGRNSNAADQDTVDLAAELARGWPDRYIASILNRIGCKTGAGNSWSENRVKSFRGQHSIPVFAHDSRRPWLTMEEAAKHLNVTVAVVRTMVERGQLPARQIAKGIPWMIERENLSLPSVVNYARDARSRRSLPREDGQQFLIP
jgi:excisionase family DNA binding protein